ncbi:UDP-2,3-diacylglucosamine diphosphatase [bacterium]|nr:UDP-2,3-diacylglucosamine diphosphatase [bacterium]
MSYTIAGLEIKTKMIEFPSPAYFLADCHLPLIPRPEQESRTQEVVHFLREKCSDAATLFLVGDIFDFWFEWRHSIPSGAFPVLAELRELAEKGTKVVYMAGNHDGHVGSFMEQKVGLIVTRESMDVQIDGRKLHVLHGDGIAAPDAGYRMLRRLVRWRWTESIYKLVHPDFGIWFAKMISRYSRETGGNKKATAIRYYKEYAEHKLDQGFNYVVMGHIHSALFDSHPNGGFIVIGDWMNKHSYARFADGEMRLEYFNE